MARIGRRSENICPIRSLTPLRPRNWPRWIPWLRSGGVCWRGKEAVTGAQFRAGLLSARAVATLDNNLSEFLDKQGKVPMTDRGYLEKVCSVSKLTRSFQDLPLLKGYFSDRITVSYDAAKAFVVSQQDIAKLVDTMAKDLDESGDPKKLQQNTKLIKDEIRQNRLTALHCIRDLHENYPEATVGIETKDAIRSVLNHERNTIRKLKSDGMLESDEASRMIIEVEQRMKESWTVLWNSGCPSRRRFCGK